MKWKDSGDMAEKEDKPRDDYFDEEQFSPWAEGRGSNKGKRFSRATAIPLLLILAIIALVVVIIILLNGGSDSATANKLAALEDRLQQLEQRFDKYTSMDEKVTRIWEQAKSFEKFKDRFDRSEASTSLRMDHLTMSLETLQKQLNEKQTTRQTTPKETDKTQPVESKVHYHMVTAGDTLYSISKKYNVSVDELRRLNQMTADSIIVPGQKLVVPK